MGKIIFSWLIFFGLTAITPPTHASEWNSLTCVNRCTETSCKNPTTLQECQIKCQKFKKQVAGCFKNNATAPATPLSANPTKPEIIQTTPSLKPLPTLPPNLIENKQPDKEISEVPSSPTFLDNGLPADIKERDKFLKRVYEEVFPIFLSYDVARGGEFLSRHAKLASPTASDSKWSYALPDVLFFPIPFAPYQIPNPFRQYLLPQNKEELELNNHLLNFQKNTCDLIVKKLKNMLREDQNYDTILIAQTPSPDQWEAYLQQHFITSAPAFQDARKIIEATNPTLSIPSAKKIKLTDTNIKDIRQLIKYYSYYISAIEKYLDTFNTPQSLDTIDDLWIHLPGKISDWAKNENGHKYHHALKLLKQLRPYFLRGKKSAHKLINVIELQEMANAKKEQAIVIDSDHIHSPYLTYSKDYIKDPSAKTPHNRGVSGIIGMHEELKRSSYSKDIIDIKNHIKGVAAGAQILPIDWKQLTQTGLQNLLKMIKNSSARVINISMSIHIPQKCASAIHTATSPIISGVTDTECKFLDDLFDLINKKDMLLVIAAGNEGIQYENFKWPSGDFLDPPTPYHSRGMHHFHDVNDSLLFWEDIAHTYKNFPMIKDRVILVGNLKEDGVTVDSSSILPGVASEDFIYAPSQGFLSLSEKSYEIVMQGKPYQYKSPLGEFGGTSGAAPRVTGVLILLSNVFKKALEKKVLTMGDLRQCVLNSGDPFWLLNENKFDELKGLCGVNPSLQKALYASNPNQESTLPRFNPNWRRDNPNLSSIDICPKSNDYGRRIYGRGRLNAMAAFDKCLDLLKERHPKVPLIEWFSSSK